MSRTYRRTTKHTKCAWLPNIYISRYYNGQSGQELYSWKTKFSNDNTKYGSDPEKIDQFLKENPKYYNELNCWFISRYTPSWYRKHTTDIPNRIHDRKFCCKLIRDEVDFDEILWSCNHKPNKYW